MTTLINRIAKKAQLALASALIAGSLLAAMPTVAGATLGPSKLPCGGADYNGDGRVSAADLIIAMRSFGQVKSDGTTWTALDMLRVMADFGQTC